MTSQHVPGFHGEDPGPATQPWRPSPQEQPSASLAGRVAARPGVAPAGAGHYAAEMLLAGGTAAFCRDLRWPA